MATVLVLGSPGLGWGQSDNGENTLPGAGITMEKRDGEWVWITQNGRFVFHDPPTDTWTGETIDSERARTRSRNRFPFEQLGIEPAEVAAYSFGPADGPPVLLIVSPGCKPCREILRQAVQLRDQYRIHLLMAPVMGESARRKLYRLACGDTAPKQVARRIAQQDYSGLPADLNDCQRPDLSKRIQKGLVIFSTLNIKGLPVAVAPDERLNRGLPDQGLRAFLAQENQGGAQ